MPYALSIHVPYELFWTLNPKGLRPFTKAHETSRKLMDEEAWLHGLYTYRAVLTAIDREFGGEKSKLEYPEKPYSQSEAKSSEESSEDELIRNHEAFFSALDLMKANYDLEKRRKESEKQTTESEVVTHG